MIGNGSISPSVPVIVPSSPPTLVSFTITPALGRTALYGGTCPLASSTATNFTVSPLSDCTVVVIFLEPAVLDVDGSSGPTKYDPATDGAMILRYLFGLRGDAITNGLMSATATLTALQTQDHLVSIRSQLDIDGNGRIEPLTDGMMILRYMMGLRMPLVTLGVLGTGATRTLAEIDAYLGSLMP